MKKITLVYAAALCGLLVSCAMADVRPVPPPRMVADMEPIELGKVETVTNKMMSTRLDKGSLDMVYDPRTDNVLFNYRNSTGGKVQLLLSREARRMFIDSFSLYNNLYEAKQLIISKETGIAFGTVPATLKWGGFMSMDAEGVALLEYGYDFKDGSPWFTFGVPVTININYDETKMNYSQKSSPKIFYFNRSKAAEIATLLDQETLESLVSSPKVQESIPDSIEVDDDY